ncbi:MAG: hypothetical protein LBN27_12835 [Prevotellaceae bacterium]|nr:hypothetical protein [Prevotellaceae bacterium]
MVAIAICLAGFTMFSGCNKNDPKKEYPLNGMGYQESEGEMYPYILTCLQDGSCLKVFEKQDITDSVFYYDGKKMIAIKYDTDEMPVKIYTPDLLYVLTDYQGNSVTISTYNKQGQKTKEESVVYDNSLTSVQMKSNIQSIGRGGCPGFVRCRPKPLLRGNPTRYMAARIGLGTKILDESAYEAFWSSENGAVLRNNYNTFADNPDTGGIIRYEGGLTWDKPVTPPTPTPQKGCYVLTLSVSCSGVSIPPQSSTICDATEAEVKEAVRIGQEAWNKANADAGSPCSGTYSYKKQ